MIKKLKQLRNLAAFMQLPKSERRIVFYSEGKPYWPHLKGLLAEFLKISDIPVCYVSSHEDDPGLYYEHPRLRKFAIDETWIRNWFFANVDTDVMVMTMPDLQQYQVKKSIHPVHYVYVPHSLVSCHMAYRRGAFDYYNTIFCTGEYQIHELRAMEMVYELPEKNLVEYGYSRLDAIYATRGKHISHDPPHILIAPSWGQNGLIETVGNIIITYLLEHHYPVTLRPHPQTMKFSAARVDLILQKHRHHPLFTFETDVSTQDSLHDADIMISDWSGAALEYAFGLEKPVLFIDLPRKINNPHYTDINITPFEVDIRDKIGAIVPLSQLEQLDKFIADMMAKKDWPQIISQLRDSLIFNVGKSDQVGAAELLKLL